MLCQDIGANVTKCHLWTGGLLPCSVYNCKYTMWSVQFIQYKLHTLHTPCISIYNVQAALWLHRDSSAQYTGNIWLYIGLDKTKYIVVQGHIGLIKDRRYNVNYDIHDIVWHNMYTSILNFKSEMYTVYMSLISCLNIGLDIGWGLYQVTYK